MIREEGYYWVKLRSDKDWVTAKWNGLYWELFGSHFEWHGNELYEINEERIKEPE